MSDYKRLTKQAGWHKDIDLKDELGYSYIYQRLAELENKIEQGTLIELPILDEDILEDYAHRMFDSWNDITGAIHNGCSWYYEVLSVIDDIVGMVYGITKRQAENKLKELENGEN